MPPKLSHSLSIGFTLLNRMPAEFAKNNRKISLGFTLIGCRARDIAF